MKSKLGYWSRLALVLTLIALFAGCAGARRRGGGRGGDGGGRSRQPGALNKEVETIASNRYTVIADNGEELSVPMVANRIERGSPDIQRAIILVPAVGRQIQGKHVRVSRMAREENAIDTTLIVGLQFLYESDLEDHDLSDQMLYWDDYGWSQGDTSMSTPAHPRPMQISSFAIVDSVVAQMIAEFPNLNTIIVTGQSAGSKFTQRYAAGTRMPEQHPDKHFGFISNNGGTFLYMNDVRPEPGTLDDWFTPDPDECERFNEYPLGLENLNLYMQRVGAQSIRDVYETRNYVYLIGSADTRPDYDFCAYVVQGYNRYDRNRAYWNYLQMYYGEDITEHQHFHIIEGYEHSDPVYDTPIGRHYLFYWVPGDPSTYEM